MRRAMRSKNNGKLYAQASHSGNNTRDVLKIKEAFPNLQAKKIENIQKIINGDGKSKPKLIMTMKGPSSKQVIVPMNNNNKMSFMEDSSNHVTNLNRALKNIKSDIMVDFIHQEQSGVTIIINKVISSLNLQTIKKYVKSTNHIEANEVEVPQLPQSKSYLKIIGILYLGENTNTLITSDVVEEIINKNHIFNNIMLASKPRIIKDNPNVLKTGNGSRIQLRRQNATSLI